MDPGETWVHGKENLTNQILLLICYIYYDIIKMLHDNFLIEWDKIFFK